MADKRDQDRQRRIQRVHTIFDPPATAPGEDWPSWRSRLNHIIFGAVSPAGRTFDWALLVLIGLSVVVVMLESVTELRGRWGDELRVIEWALTVVFTAEYILRMAVVKRPLGYATSFFGVVDLVSLLPTWLSLVFAGSHVLAVIRVLRMLRVFRMLQLSQFAAESQALAAALVASFSRITVFLGTVLAIVVIMGSTMYLVEGADAGFDSIPRSVYWAIVTMTTVGYGDIAPKTPLGQAIAAAVMILGYAIIAVPTGIVSAELVRDGQAAGDEGRKPKQGACPCPGCGAVDHGEDARFCRRCGDPLQAE